MTMGYLAGRAIAGRTFISVPRPRNWWVPDDPPPYSSVQAGFPARRQAVWIAGLNKMSGNIPGMLS
jgi:hypothetical protein